MFGLARELGMTVAELGARMTAAELTEWMAFYRIEAETTAERQAKAEMAARAAAGARAEAAGALARKKGR